MKQLTDLTTDEIKYICGKIPVSMVRTYFQKNPHEFAEIKKGFRPDKLTDAETVALLSRNITKPFIASFVEKTVKKWLEEIADCQKKLVDEGYSEGEALLKTIPDSFFCDDCALYFKLNETQVDSKYTELFRDAISLLEQEADNREVTQSIDAPRITTEDRQDEIYILKEELKEKTNELEMTKSALDEAINSLAESKEESIALEERANRIAKELSEAQMNIATMQPELDKYRNLESVADSAYKDEERYQHISVGVISHDLSGQIWINRLADIVKGRIIPFHSDEFSPKVFDNRDRLFWKDGPDENGDIGVWGWRADPRDTDPSKDYVVCEYHRFAQITEIVDFQNCHSVSDITGIITEKFTLNASSEKMLLTCTTANGLKEGLLCNFSDFEMIGGEARLLPSVFSLRKYEFKDNDCIQIAGKWFYRSVNLGTPQGIVRPRTPFEVIKRLLLNRVSVPTLRERGLTKKEAQKCLGFLKDIPEDTVVQEFMCAYGCEESEAQEYIAKFIEHAESYFTDNDFDTNILSSALERNVELVQKCKEALREEWENECNDKISEWNTKLKEAEIKVVDKETESERLEQKKEELTKEIEEKEKLATDVEKHISKRIHEAKENAAEFISQMAFMAPALSINDALQTSGSGKVRHVSSNVYLDSGEIVDIESFEEELAENLIISGFEELASIEMAQAIRFCISSGLPLIINENSKVIADCAAGVLGRKIVKEYYVPLAGEDSRLILSDLAADNEKLDVVLIHGVFDGYSNNLFNAIISMLRNLNSFKFVIMSIQGLDPRILSKDVWNHAFYINGDANLRSYQRKALKAYSLNVEIDLPIDEKKFYDARKELSAYGNIVSNTAKNNYAKYLSLYELSIGSSWLIQLQLMTVARSEGLEEELLEVYQNRGINVIDTAY